MLNQCSVIFIQCSYTSVPLVFSASWRRDIWCWLMCCDCQLSPEYTLNWGCMFLQRPANHQLKVTHPISTDIQEVTWLNWLNWRQEVVWTIADVHLMGCIYCSVSRGNKWMSPTLMTETFMFCRRTSVFTLCVIYSYISGKRRTFEIFIGAAERRVEPPGSILLIPSSFIYTETLWVIRKCIKTQRWSLHVDAGWWWGWGNRQ